ALSSPLLSLTRPPPAQRSPLSLHDALPISPLPEEAPAPPAAQRPARLQSFGLGLLPPRVPSPGRRGARPTRPGPNPIGQGDRPRSEEHTSELQSRENLVCRLLLEKKKQQEE